MDANDSNESAIRQRDARLARRLGEALDRLNPQSAGNCPDAEVIAAYSEQALGVEETAQYENHFASCGRCRNILKVLAAGSDAPLAETEVADLGQRVSAVRAPVEITAGEEKRSRSKAAMWSTRWLAPAVGVAAVLVVWFVMRPPWRAMDQKDATTLIAQAPHEEMPQPAPLAVDRAQQAAPSPEVPPAKTAMPYSNPQTSTSDNLKSRDSLQEVSPNADLAKSLSAEKKENSPLASDEKAKTLSAPLASPAPSQAAVSSAMNSAVPPPQARKDSGALASAAPAAPNPAAADAIRSTGQSVTAAEAVPAAEGTNKPAAAPLLQEPASEAPLNGRNFQALRQLRLGGAPPLLLKPAAGLSLWRAGLAGMIERSTDAGKTWAPQISPFKDDWLAGAAISGSICWLAGRNGTLARTMDGEHWERIAPPAQAAANNGKWPDWTAITAQNAQSATITSSDGNKFATTDGGKTWQQH